MSTIDQGPDPFALGNEKAKTPHAGMEGVPAEVREVPVEGAVPITSDLDSIQIPGTAPDTPEDREVAQQARIAIAERKKGSGRNKIIAISGAVAALALIVGPKAAGKFIGHEVADATFGSDQTASATAFPSESTETSPETADGIKLTSEQLADLESGDPARIGKVMNKVFLRPAEAAISDYVTDPTANVDMSFASSDPRVTEYMKHFVDQFQDYDGLDTETVGATVAFCDANVPNEDAVGTGCEGDFSTIVPGQALVLKGIRITYDDLSSLRKENQSGLDSTAQDGSYITPEVVGDTLTFTVN